MEVKFLRAIDSIPDCFTILKDNDEVPLSIISGEAISEDRFAEL